MRALLDLSYYYSFADVERSLEAARHSGDLLGQANALNNLGLITERQGRVGEAIRYGQRAMEAGASGFVVKDTPARQLAEAVRRVHAGLRVLDSALAEESLVSGASPLTARETDVVRLVAQGLTNAEITAELVVSMSTVKTHLSSVQRKLGARNRTEIAIWAWRHRLVR